MTTILNDIESRITALFEMDSSGHDMHHLKRVLNTALHLHEKEGGDELVIAAAALLHDIHRIIETKTGKYCSPRDSLSQVSGLLNDVSFPEEKSRQVLHCVEFHEEYGFSDNGKTVDDIETLILQDADNLDAIGAIGIARTFVFGGAHGVAMWNPEIPFDRPTYDESHRDPSVIHHFHSKLLKLKENMNTETARRMAQKRHEFMELFISEFVGEWQGKK